MKELLSCWQSEAYQLKGMQILTYLAKCHFDIQRLPQYEDRRLSLKEQLDSNMKNYKDLDKLKNDFDILYRDTQKRLEKQFKEEFTEQEKNRIDKHILLSRRILRKEDLEENKTRYTNLYKCDLYPVETLKDVMTKQKENKEIELPMDILTSWSENAVNTYGVLQLNKRVPPEDIIFFTHRGDFGGPLESNEYIVLNRTPTGIISFSPTNISVDSSVGRMLVSDK